MASWSRYFSFSSFFLFSKVSITVVVFIQMTRPKLQEGLLPSVPLPSCCVSVPACRAWPASLGTRGPCSTSEHNLPSQLRLWAGREASRLSEYEEEPNNSSTAARGCSASSGAVLCAWPPLTFSGPVRAFSWATALLERTDSLSGTPELSLSSFRLSSEGMAEQPGDSDTGS